MYDLKYQLTIIKEMLMREVRAYFKKKGNLFMMAIFPCLIFILIMSPTLAFYTPVLESFGPYKQVEDLVNSRLNTSYINESYFDEELLADINSTYQDRSEIFKMMEYMKQNSIYLVYMLVIMWPMFLCVDIITRERDRENSIIESLFLSPISSLQYVLGKSLSVTLLSMAPTFVVIILGWIISDILMYPALGCALYPDLNWLLTLFIICPMMIIIATMYLILVALCLSRRSILKLPAMFLNPAYMILVPIATITNGLLDVNMLIIVALLLFIGCIVSIIVSSKILTRDRVMSTGWV